MNHLTTSKRISAMAEFCIDYFGTEQAENLCAEECSELIQALLKVQRHDISEEKRQQTIRNIATEMCQVLYTMEEVMEKYGITLKDLDDEVIPKLQKYNVSDPGGMEK